MPAILQIFKQRRSSSVLRPEPGAIPLFKTRSLAGTSMCRSSCGCPAAKGFEKGYGTRLFPARYRDCVHSGTSPFVVTASTLTRTVTRPRAHGSTVPSGLPSRLSGS